MATDEEDGSQVNWRSFIFAFIRSLMVAARIMVHSESDRIMVKTEPQP